MPFNSPMVYTLPPPCLHPASMGKWLEYSTSEPEIWVQILRGPDFRLKSQSFNYPEDIVGLLHFKPIPIQRHHGVMVRTQAMDLRDSSSMLGRAFSDVKYAYPGQSKNISISNKNLAYIWGQVRPSDLWFSRPFLCRKNPRRGSKFCLIEVILLLKGE